MYIKCLFSNKILASFVTKYVWGSEIHSRASAATEKSYNLHGDTHSAEYNRLTSTKINHIEDTTIVGMINRYRSNPFNTEWSRSAE